MHESPTVQYALLAGWPSVREFVRVVKRTALGGQSLDEVLLADEWARANERLRQLESIEAGIADVAEPPELPADLVPMANEALEDATTRRGLSLLPYRWGLIDIDRLVVFQKRIDLTFAEQLKRLMPPEPTAAEVVRLASKSPENQPPVLPLQTDGNTFTFSSPSNDLRVLNITSLAVESVRDPLAYSRASSVLGVFVGYGANMIQVLRMHNRVALVNGSHRLFALRQLGITQVPCLIQTARRKEDMEMLGAPEILANYERYFVSPRPPLFKDYRDDSLRKVITAPKQSMMLQIELTIRQAMVPSL